MSIRREYLRQNQSQFISDLKELVSFPSVSSLPEHAPDIEATAKWLVRRLEKVGLENVELVETAGGPVVYADWLHAEGKPSILVYGHYDVQPADPLDLWDSPPFQPEVRDGCLYGRGASDNKGNLLAALIGLEAMLQAEGALPVNVKLFLEGEEEVGSPNSLPLLAQEKERFACDICVNADGIQYAPGQPTILYSFRGLAAFQVDVQGADSDLHSGIYGGTVANPLHALAEIVASFHSPEGGISVDGFYDAVADIDAEERSRLARAPYNEAQYLSNLGLDAVFGEPGYSTNERAWRRPTLEVNGMWGGFLGEGTKTVLPNSAHAKITCRLVAHQDPNKVLQAITAHVEKVSPPGVKTTVTLGAGKADPYLLPLTHPGVQILADAYLELYETDPIYIGSGGTIPVTAAMLEELGVYSLVFGFCARDEQIHAPNEFFRLSSFETAQDAYGILFHRLAAADSLVCATA